MKITTILFLIIVAIGGHAQTDSLFDQGTYRTYILHLPSGYDESKEYPLVLNFHGLGSNGSQQQLYSQFDAVADHHEMIVVYPDAINNSWDIFGSGDVDFIAHLVDNLRQQYSINECLFSMGMSQGGFLSYKLACELPHTISAIAVVTGNMLESWQNTCTVDEGTSIVHFHGTADQVVMYNGSFGVSPVEESVQWWASEYNCNEPPFITPLPDINQSDDSTVELYQYYDCDEANEVVLYKIINGGHTWPGAFPVPSLGNTNQDIDASELIGDFFNTQCNLNTRVQSFPNEHKVLIYPNPAVTAFSVELRDQPFNLSIFDVSGHKMKEIGDPVDQLEIDCHNYPDGIYFLRISIDHDVIYRLISILK